MALRDAHHQRIFRHATREPGVHPPFTLQVINARRFEGRTPRLSMQDIAAADYRALHVRSSA